MGEADSTVAEATSQDVAEEQTAIAEEEETPKPWAAIHPKLFDIIPLTWELGEGETVPEADGPYFLETAEALCMVKNSFLGKSVVPTKNRPPTLKSLKPYFKGVFFYGAKPLPAAVIAQAVDFFRMVWFRYKTEAELLLIYSEEKDQYRLFVPQQKVTSGSVDSIYDPEDIPKGFYVIGSLHSHCNFGAFHSGTDSRDAATFTGLHITVGHVDRKMPEFAVMVVMDGIEFDYSKQLPLIMDLSNLEAKSAPEVWFNFLIVQEKVGKRVKRHLRERLEEKFKAKTTTTTGPKANTAASPVIPATVTHYPTRGPVTTGNPWLRLFSRTSYGTGTTYSNELRCNLPDRFFEKKEQSWNQPKLSWKEFPNAIQLLLEDLADLAAEFDIELNWEVVDRWQQAHDQANAEANADTVEKEGEEKQNPDDDGELETSLRNMLAGEPVTEETLDALLPGAMEIIDAHEIDEIHRRPLVN